MRSSSIHVAAGVLRDNQGKILLAKRHAGTHQGDLWEFPGGKLESGEAVEHALKRELEEELGIRITAHRPLIRVFHTYSDRNILLDVHLVTRWQGDVSAMEGQPLVWVGADELPDYSMPEADRPAIKAIQLPGTYLITPPVIDDEKHFVSRLKRALEQGVSLVQFRVFDCPGTTSCKQLAIDVLQLCHAYGARMLLNGEIELAMEMGAHGVHLAGRQLMAMEDRPLSKDYLIAASCHSSEELAKAGELDLDFAVLSPVLPTTSHPGAETLGWERFTELAEQVAIPVYALGGMKPELLYIAWSCGAQGIAGISGLLSD